MSPALNLHLPVSSNESSTSPTPPVTSQQPQNQIDSPLELQHVPLTFENDDQNKSALTLVYAVAPEWRSDPGPVEFLRFTEGITNTLMKAMKRRPQASASEIDQDSILIRAFGEGTNTLIDRDRELKAHNLLAKLGLAPALLARFNNGLMYRFIEGDVCSPKDLRKPEIYRLVAQRLGQWHAVLPISALATTRTTPHRSSQSNGTHEVNGHPPVDSAREATKCPTKPYPNMWTVMQKWIDVLPTSSAADAVVKEKLQAEYNLLIEQFGNLKGLDGRDFVFSHCDLLSGNVIMSRPELQTIKAGSKVTSKAGPDSVDSVSFIDYEYATPAPAAFDIANHLAEWGGLDCEYGALPSRSQRREFLQSYVASFRAHSPRVAPNELSSGTPGNHESAAVQAASPSTFDEDVSQLSDQVDLLRGLPGFYWGIWALIQATISQIDFDYQSYAQLRFGEYWDWKAEWDGSRQAQRRPIGTRERRWAAE